MLSLIDVPGTHERCTPPTIHKRRVVYGSRRSDASLCQSDAFFHDSNFGVSFECRSFNFCQRHRLHIRSVAVLLNENSIAERLE